MQEGLHMNEEAMRRFAIGSKGLAFCLVLILVSLLLLIEEGDEISAMVWSLCISAICVPLLTYQRIRFGKRQSDLLKKGVNLESYDYGRQRRLIEIITVTAFAGMVAPFVLSGLIPATVWFGALIGLLDGWMLYLILFNAIVWLWERKHDGVLYRLELWNGSRVTHIGLKFQQSKEK
jgi:ABC-type Fe3+ transport system permease subunit